MIVVLAAEFDVLSDFVEKIMFPKSVRHAGRVENMDEYLQSLGLWRKVIPKDGASLYRVVAEQVRRRKAVFTLYATYGVHYM